MLTKLCYNCIKFELLQQDYYFYFREEDRQFQNQKPFYLNHLKAMKLIRISSPPKTDQKNLNLNVKNVTNNAQLKVGLRKSQFHATSAHCGLHQELHSTEPSLMQHFRKKTIHLLTGKYLKPITCYIQGKVLKFKQRTVT